MQLPALTTDVPPRPQRPETTHKGQAGHVAIIAGSRGMSGAAVLCGLGALRGGAGLVRVLCPEEIQPIVAASESCYMTVPITPAEAGTPGMNGKLQQQVYSWATAVAVGPGLGLGDLALNNATEWVEKCSMPLVMDADALNALAARAGSSPTAASRACGAWWGFRQGRPTVITPHPGEMARLRRAAGLPDRSFDSDDARLAVAHEYATLSGAVVVLKGCRTVVFTKDQAYINTTGNAGMASGGMGDVLTGLIAALIAQGMTPFDAARLGVFAHGLAADHLAERIAPVGYLAREVADALPAALAAASRPRVGFH